MKIKFLVVQWSNVAMEIADKWQNRYNRRGSATTTNTVADDANHSYNSRVNK